jgi:hypothetical protein
MTDLVVVQEVASNEVVLVFQPGGAVVITPPAAPPTVLIATPGGGGTDIVALPGQVIFANAAGDIVGSNKLRFVEDTYPVDSPNWATLFLDGDFDCTGTLYSNSVVDPTTKDGGGALQIGVQNPNAPTEYYGVAALYAGGNYADNGAFTNGYIGMMNIILGRDVFTVNPLTNVVTFPDPVIAKSITVQGGSQSVNAIVFANATPGNEAILSAPNAVIIRANSKRMAMFGAWGLQLASDVVLQWGNAQDVVSTIFDIGLGRNTAGVLEINNGGAGQYRDLIVRDLFLGSPTTGARLQDTGGGVRVVNALVSNYAPITALGLSVTGGVVDIALASNSSMAWSNAQWTPGQTKDIALQRNAAGILEVNNASDKRVALRINTTQSSFDVVFDGVRRAQFGMGFRLGADCGFAWASNAAGNNSDNPLDTGFTRNAAGVIEINNGTPGQFRDLWLRNLILDDGSVYSGVLSGTSGGTYFGRKDQPGTYYAVIGSSGHAGMGLGPFQLWWGPAVHLNSVDVAINRTAAGVLEINNGTVGTPADLKCRRITTVLPTAVTGLPSGTLWNNGGVVNVAP